MIKKQFISFLGICSLFFFGKPFFLNTMEGEDQKKQDGLAIEPVPDYGLINADLSFAGQRVPLENSTVKRRFILQLNLNQGWKPMAANLIHKSWFYFPVIRPILKKYGIPDDFKYVPLIESGFSDKVSYSGAAGPWQMMPATARHYGLEVNGQIDERFNMVRSTEAACKMIKDLHNNLKDWTLVAAAFNKGLSGVKGAINRQKKHTYYQLHLNGQAQQYVFRILAAKKIMGNSPTYGSPHNMAHFHYSVPTFKVKLNKSVANLGIFARKHGISLKTLKVYNPWLKANRFDNPSNKNYIFEIPRLNEISMAMGNAR